MSSRTASILVLVFAGVGLAVSIYLTIAHYTTPALLACGSNGVVNCERVTTSRQSSILGIPVALLGIVWFLAVLAISLPRVWNRPPFRTARLIVAVVGMAFVLWLIYAELVLIGAICLWCTVAHICAFAIFVVVLYEASRAPQP